MKLLFTGLVALLSLHMAGQIIRIPNKSDYTLNIPEILCHKTTEDHADEIYTIILYKYSTGESGTKTVPNKHWDIYAGGAGIVANNLFNFKLQKFQSIDILCIMMEEDDFSIRDWLSPEIFKHLNASESKLVNIQADEIKRVIEMQSLYFLNTDDWIGSFVMHVKEGGYVSNYRLIHNPNGTNFETPAGGPPYKFTFDGDGSSYEGFVNIR